MDLPDFKMVRVIKALLDFAMSLGRIRGRIGPSPDPFAELRPAIEDYGSRLDESDRCGAVLLGAVPYHSERFLMPAWHKTREALCISSMWVTFAVPTAVAIILFHLMAKLFESGAGEVRGKS